jgi:hypothetical protein
MQVTQFKFIPYFPVQFSYNNANDSLPNVIVLKLLHDEDNPGFLGVNLNLLNPLDRNYFLQNYQRQRLASKTVPFELTGGLLNLAQGNLRRYNYDKIGEFIYRGSPKNWRKTLGMKLLTKYAE